MYMFFTIIILFTYIAKPDITEISMVMSHNTAIFHCKATGKPLAAIHWLKDGMSFDDSERTDITITYFSTGSSCNDTDPADQCVKSSTVQIHTTTSKDSGNYTCVASNDYGSKAKSLQLIVNSMWMVNDVLIRLLCL